MLVAAAVASRGGREFMRVSWNLRGSQNRLRFRLDPGESTTGTGQRGAPIGMITDSCRFRMPTDVDPPHPDVAAVAAMTIVNPWLRRKITFDRAISPRLAGVLAESFGIDAGPVDRELVGRDTGSQVGLSYSGGSDSVAVGELLPPGSPYVHLRRVRHPRVPNRASHFRADVTAHFVQEAGRRGREVSIVESDLEFIVHPYPSFPEWTAVVAGAALLADTLDLGGVAFGTVLGAVYLEGGRRFHPPSLSDKWSRLFSAVGLPFVRPASGMSEVATTQIAEMSDLGGIVRSCSLGTLDGACMNCMKCLRKDLIAAALAGRPLDPVLSHNMDERHAVVLELTEPPPYHQQHLLEYALARVPGIENTFLAAANAYLEPSRESTSWATRFYPPALEQEVPEKWRAGVEEQLRRRVLWMSSDDVQAVESWDAADRNAPQRRG